MRKRLTLLSLKREARKFARVESKCHEAALYGVTDGKAVGTYFEHKFKHYLEKMYVCSKGNSASGIDFPDLNVDMKVTSIRQPQSSCPFRSARQKVFGLGYSLLVFVYEKTDNSRTRKGNLRFDHVVFIQESRTADFQTTSGLRRIIENDGNIDDIMGFLEERHLPLDEIQARQLAEEITASPPETGYLTISNALQWRLQYSRIIEKAGKVGGILKIL